MLDLSKECTSWENSWLQISQGSKTSRCSAHSARSWGLDVLSAAYIPQGTHLPAHQPHLKHHLHQNGLGHWPCRAHKGLLQTHCPSCNACGWLVTQHSSAGPKCCQVPVRPAATATSDGSLWASVHAPSGHPCKNTQIIAGHFCCYGKSYVSISITNPYLEEFSNVTIKLCSEP